jgi:phosphohistidine swiveling domain-containing protein
VTENKVYCKIRGLYCIIVIISIVKLVITENLIMRLNERTNASVVLTKEGTYYLDYVALESREVLDDSVTECSGTPACKGKVTANARIVLTTADFGKFKQGDVLIAEGTRPEYVPIMKQASAIVTDEGGLTCHAAIVSRELNTPCIVGTKIATRIIKDGDLVEVDADKGIVRKIN